MLQYPLSGSNDFIIDLPNVSTRSYNSSFTLDFGSSSAWYLNFDNNAFAFLNHRYVSVSYDSCSPNNSGGKVRATPHKLQSFRLAEVYQHILWITSAVLPAKAH